MSLQLLLNWQATTPDGSDFSSPVPIDPIGGIDLGIPIGEKGHEYNADVLAGSDTQFDVGEVSELGYCKIENRSTYVQVVSPDAPEVEPIGTAGAATWSYKIVAKQDDGSYSAASSVGTTTTGNATLDDTNFNALTWPDVPGATSYDVYRTAHGTTPSTNGLIGNTTSAAFNDTGFAGDSSTAPATGIDNLFVYGSTDEAGVVADYPFALKGGEQCAFRWNKANATEIHGTSSVPLNPAGVRVKITILDD